MAERRVHNRGAFQQLCVGLACVGLMFGIPSSATADEGSRSPGEEQATEDSNYREAWETAKKQLKETVKGLEQVAEEGALTTEKMPHGLIELIGAWRADTSDSFVHVLPRSPDEKPTDRVNARRTEAGKEELERKRWSHYLKRLKTFLAGEQPAILLRPAARQTSYPKVELIREIRESMPHQAFIPLLKLIAENPEEPDAIRSTACYAIGTIPHKDPLRTLIPLLGSDSKSVANEAYSLLWRGTGVNPAQQDWDYTFPAAIPFYEARRDKLIEEHGVSYPYIWPRWK